MASSHVHFFILLCSCWVLCASAKPPHVSTPAPTSVDCASELLNLADCLTFVEEGSKEAKPKGQCCPGLKKVIKDQVTCLCQAFSGGANYGVKLNMTKALALPSACGVKNSPLSNCNISAPGSAPVSAPGAAPAYSPTSAPLGSPPAPASVAVSVAALPVCLFFAVATAAAALFPIHL